MDGLGNVRIQGKSGKEYKFRAYPLATKFDNIGAVYFITSRKQEADGRTSHSRIDCGRTSNLSIGINIKPGFKDNDANCICILPQDDKDTRIEIETDIRQNYTLLCSV
jgi:hypothetical protein